MTKTSHVRAELQVALSDPPLPPQVSDYYIKLLDRLKDLTDSGRRAAFGLLLVAAVIELLNRAAISNIDVGPVQISDMSTVRKLLPLLAAYLIYDAVAAGVRYAYARRVATEVDRIYRPALVAGPYLRYAYPPTPNLLGPLPWYQTESRTVRLVTRYNLMLKLAYVLAPSALEVSWYWRLFSDFGFRDIVLDISLVLSICIFVYSCLLAWLAVQDGVFTLPVVSRGEF